MMWMAWLLIIIISISRIHLLFRPWAECKKLFIFFLSLFYFSITEDDSESHIIKLTAFFTSILLTISVAIFFIIVLRKNREHPTVNEDPSKKVHLGKTWRENNVFSYLLDPDGQIISPSQWNEWNMNREKNVFCVCIYRSRSIWDNASGDERGTAKICGLVHA